MNSSKLIFSYSQILNFQADVVLRDNFSGIDCLIKEFEDWQIIHFRESNEKIDWITNFTFWFTLWKRPDYAREDSKIRVHSGYFNGWMRIRDQVLDNISKDKLLVIGFSMGGGVSSIAAVDIQYNKQPGELYCYNFDGPKVWNKAGMESTNKRLDEYSYYIKNGNDVVSKIPPFYKHAGTKIHIGEKEFWWKMSFKDHAEFFENPVNIRKQLEQL